MDGTPSTQTASLGTPRPACRSLGLEHRLLDNEYGSFVGRAVQAVKDRAECFDDHFPCRRGEGCRLHHLQNWLRLFIPHRDPEYLMMIIGLAKQVIGSE